MRLPCRWAEVRDGFCVWASDVVLNEGQYQAFGDRPGMVGCRTDCKTLRSQYSMCCVVEDDDDDDDNLSLIHI